VIDSRKKRLAARGGNGAGPSGSLFEEKSRKSGRGGPVKVRDRLSVAQLKELEEGKVKEVLRGFKRIRELWGRVIASEDEGHTEHGGPKDEAEREWLFEAERLVETFRETRNLFLTSRVGGYCFRQRLSADVGGGIAECSVPRYDSKENETTGG
jgi:general transcription factor 3C polypeptide 3 (transcription factor C subunit 4)